MKHIIFISFLLICSSKSLGEETYKLMYYQASSTIPQDIGLALGHLQLHTDDPSKVRQKIIILDQLLEHLQEQELLMLGKTELYKAIFRRVQNQRPRLEMYELDSLRLAREAYEASKQKELTHPYLALLMGGLLNDIQGIMEAPGYRTFLVRLRANPNQLEGDHLITQRKLEMILPWLQWYQEGELDGVNYQLTRALDWMLDSMVNRFNDYYYLTRFQRLSIQTERQGDLTFFGLQPRPDLDVEPRATEPRPPTLEETLAPVLDYVPPAQLPEPVNDWLPRDSAQDFFNPSPDPGYTPPTRLPDPVNDWFRSP